ncbi:MAG: ATP-binding protein [Bradymonadaceae bacterium]
MDVWRNRSLRTKIISVFLVPTLVIVLLYGLLAYFSARAELEEELGKRLVSVGRAVAAELSDGFYSRQIAGLDAGSERVRSRLRDRLRRARDATDVRRMYLFGEEFGTLVDTEGPVPFGDTIYKLKTNRVEIRRTFREARATTSVLFEGRDGSLYKSAYVPITGPKGEVVAALGVEASPEYFSLLHNFASALTALGAVGLALIVFVGALFARALTRPLNRLVQAVRRLAEGDFEEPIVEPEPERTEGDEIDFLARTFEEMRRSVHRRDRQMKMMLSGITHEVRNPLGGMELFCGLLREELEGEGDEEKLEKLDRIERELAYLDRVVDEFRDFARESDPELERFEVRALFREVGNLLEGDVEEAGCELIVDAEDVELTADREQVRRAVINLVRNAHQACGEGGEIRLIADESTRRVIVEDDGPGMDDEQLEEVRTPFHTTKEKGSGLGLPLCEKIVERHGGALEIETSLGEGTRVELRFPFDPSVETGDSDVPDDWLG